MRREWPRLSLRLRRKFRVPRWIVRYQGNQQPWLGYAHVALLISWFRITCRVRRISVYVLFPPFSSVGNLTVLFANNIFYCHLFYFLTIFKASVRILFLSVFCHDIHLEVFPPYVSNISSASQRTNLDLPRGEKIRVRVSKKWKAYLLASFMSLGEVQFNPRLRSIYLLVFFSLPIFGQHIK
jgi:hypothetical protein